MIITHLAVDGVGRFRSRHVVRGLGPGLNLLCAPNEAGKSTLFRALQLALFARHGSKTEEMRRLACLGAEIPACIEVGFQRGGADYLVKKSFLRSTGARLYKGGTLVADGRAADEAVWAALDLVPGTSAADESTFGLLWVRQGQSFKPAVPSEETKALLSRVIEAEVGEVLGGERGERVWKSITDKLSREETKTGPKAGGPWKAALDRRAAAQTALAELRSTLAALEADRTALAGKLRERETLADAAALAQMRTDRDAAVAEREQTAKAEQATQRAETEQAQRELGLDRARKRHEELVGLDQRIGKTREKIAALTRRLAEQNAACAAQAAALAAQEQVLGALAARWAEAERAVDQARRRETAARDAERVVEISTRLARARELREGIARIRQVITTLAVPVETIKAIEAAMQALDAARARQEAKAPRVTVRVGPAGAGLVTCAGEPIDGLREIAAVGPLTVAVGDIATVEIVPVATSEDAGAVEAAREKLAKALREAGVGSLAEAYERRAKADDLQTEGRGLVAELAATAPPAAKGSKEDGIAGLERALAEAQAGLDGAGIGAAGSAPLDRDVLARERTASEQARDALHREHADAQSAVHVARSEDAAEKFRQQALQIEIGEAQSRLAEDLAVCPDAGRDERLVALAAEAAQARAAFDAAAACATQLRAALPTPEQRSALDARVKRLTEAIKGNETRLIAVEQEIANLQGRIATRGGEGLGEREAEAADALALAETDVAAIERRLAALRLLRDTIEESRRAASESFLAPVKTAMRPYLHALFPGADAALDAGFSIDGLMRAGTDEPFMSLSDGTREQIAIIVRLALGRLLAERGQPVPVVLDDSLVFSDDERIERMFDVLTQAAEKQQVIVLTCRSRAFVSCGGRLLTIEREES